MRVSLTPPPGLNSDDTTFAAGGLWEDSSGIRFRLGRPQSIGSWEAVFSDTLTGVCRNILPWTDNAGDLNIAFGTHSALEVHVGGMLYDITPSGLVEGSIDSAGNAPGYGSGEWDVGTYSSPALIYYLRTWAFDTFGETLVAVPRGGTLYQWENDTGTEAAAITNAPDEITHMLVTQERQVLALGCNEEVSGTFNPLCIRGCDIEDITDWTTSATNNAFEHILEGGGHIVAGHQIGPYVMVLTDNALHLGEFVGQPGQAYRFDLVARNCGLIGPNALHVTGGLAYWVSPDRQFRVWAPGSKPEIIPCPIRDDFADNLHSAQAQKIIIHEVSQYGELWWHYPDERDGTENSRYIAFSTIENGAPWFRGELARTAAHDADVGTNPIMATVDGAVYYHEKGTDGVEWRLKSADQYLDEAERCLQVQGIWPDFESQEADATITFYIRQYPQGAVTTKGPYTLTAGADKKDFRVTGRIMAVEFEGTGEVRFGKPSFKSVVTGER